MKLFIGYYIIGANSKQEAQDEKGLLLWGQTKPNAFRRFLCEKLLGIYWIDKERILEEKGKTKQSNASATDQNKPLVEMQKLTPPKPSPRKQN